MIIQQKENFYLQKQKQLADWENQLSFKAQEEELEKKELKLKELSKILKMESENLIRQKLELNERLQKYTRVLEQLNDQQSLKSTKKATKKWHSQSQQIKSPISSTSKISNCQQRIFQLMSNLKSTARKSEFKASASYLKQDQSDCQKFQSNQKLEECLFSLPDQKENQLRKSVKSEITIARQKTGQSDQDIHELKMKAILMNEQLFYKKVEFEIQKLKEMKMKLSQ